MIERRQTTRYDFGAIAEVIDLDTREDVIATTRDLSLSGCFIKTRAPFPKGTTVIVKIAFSGANFAATGRVTGNRLIRETSEMQQRCRSVAFQ